MNPQTMVRIWSDEHGAYWRKGGGGYTCRAPEAWMLSYADAKRQTAGCGPEKKIVLEPATDHPCALPWVAETVDGKFLIGIPFNGLTPFVISRQEAVGLLNALEIVRPAEVAP